MRVSSIELELQAKASTSWPEGIGARRIDVTEEHRVFHATSTIFRVEGAPRRPASIGPTCFELDDELEHEHDHEQEEQHTQDWHNLHSEVLNQNPTPSPPTRRVRRISADSYLFQRDVVNDPPVYSPAPYSTPLESPSNPPNQLPTVSETSHVFPSMDASRSPLSSSPPSSRSIPQISASTSNHDSASSEPRSGSEMRGRKQKSNRFSLSSVSSALLDAVRSSSPRSGEPARSTPKGKEVPREGDSTEGSESVSKAKTSRRLTLGKMLGKESESQSRKEQGTGWKEFKRGTYTYPISFSIPAMAPPTMVCTYGTVCWRLKVAVRRPGAFTPRMVASREIIVVAGPSEDDTEDTDHIVVERLWENQLQYVISISGRSFYIGQQVPITFTLMPLDKVKVHRIAVYLEEKIDYFTQFKRIARVEPASRMILLSLKSSGKDGTPILPLSLDTPEFTDFSDSPMCPVLGPNEDASEVASNFMGPGPWSFHVDLDLPGTCRLIHFSCKNRRTNMSVSHVLKCVLRLERGEEDQTTDEKGRKKQFDIVVQTPVQILSCRCKPDWTLLPHYESSSQDPDLWIAQCPCLARRALPPRVPSEPAANVQAALEPSSSDSSSDHAARSPPLVRPTPPNLDSLARINTLYDRLVSGQESESGEAPPAYRRETVPV